MYIDRTKYRKLMEEYFSCNGEENLQDWKDFILKYKAEGKLELLWGSVLYGHLGSKVRNWMRESAKWIDEEFKNFGDSWYAEFEDYSWDIFKEIVDYWEATNKK
jgi:hypothetical protein